jgi:hypothetical protein
MRQFVAQLVNHFRFRDVNGLCLYRLKRSHVPHTSPQLSIVSCNNLIFSGNWVTTLVSFKVVFE